MKPRRNHLHRKVNLQGFSMASNFEYGISTGTGCGLSFSGPVNSSSLSKILINMKCDVPRSVRIELASNVYGPNVSVFKYGWTRLVGTETKQYRFLIDNVSYPFFLGDWSPDLLDPVLASLSGITVSPHPRTVPQVPDSRFIRIDNVQFITE